MSLADNYLLVHHNDKFSSLRSVGIKTKNQLQEGKTTITMHIKEMTITNNMKPFVNWVSLNK